MKNILLGLMIFAMLIGLQNTELVAQSFELLKPTTIPEILSGKVEDGDLTSSPELKNNSTVPVSVKIAISPVLLANGHIFTYCDMESCYGPFEGFVESKAFTLNAGATTGTFIHIALMSNAVEALSILNVRFYNALNPTDEITYQVSFNVGPVGVKDPEISYNLVEVLPNPANSSINIDLSNNVGINGINIFNSNGQLVEKFEISNPIDNFIINTENYNNGTYYFSIQSDSKSIKTGRFVVIH